MKKIAAALLLIILAAPLQASAITRPVFSSLNNTPSTAGVRWTGYDTGNLSFTANPTNEKRIPVSIPGVVSDLYVQLSVDPGGTASWEIMLFKNNVATALTCTISAGATTCNDTDAGHAVTVAAGDDLSWRTTPTNTPASSVINISSKFASTNSGETAISGGGSVANTCLTDTYYAPMGSAASTTDAGVRSIAPTNFTLDHFYYRVSQAPGAGDTAKLTVYKNGVATAITATISDTAVNNSDLSNSISLAPGDYLSVRCEGTGSPTSMRHAWGFRVTPTIDGETPIFAAGSVVFSLVTRTSTISGGLTNGQTESNLQGTAPIAFDLKKFYAEIFPAQPANKNWTFNSRKNSADGTLSATIIAGDIGANDVTNTDSYAVGDKINWESNPTTGGTNTTYASLSAVLYVAPPVTPSSSLPYRVYNLGQMLLNNGTLIFR